MLSWFLTNLEHSLFDAFRISEILFRFGNEEGFVVSAAQAILIPKAEKLDSFSAECTILAENSDEKDDS